MNAILVTGATGLVGHAVLRRLLAEYPTARFWVLVRDAHRWDRASRDIPAAASRVTPVIADVGRPGLGVSGEERAFLRRALTGVVHSAANTAFSTPLDAARAVNTEGTRNILDLISECAHPVRLAYVSTAFVAGRRTGLIGEDEGDSAAGWVNGYEQSKAEAESLVRLHAADWVILRLSTIVCDDTYGAVSQFNAVHRALRLYRDGLAAMMPGVDGSSLDTVTTAYVSDAIASLALRRDTSHRTFHLCAGAGAMPLEELLDRTYQRWATDVAWRARRVERPALADLATYALFERTIDDTADPSLRRVTRLLSHFVPHLALPKCFDTTSADAALGYAAPRVRDYWIAMVDQLLSTRWWEGVNAT